MKVWLIYPPKYFWPYINMDDNFMVPQSLPYLAAVARADGHDVRIIDCSPLKIGWKSLAREIAEGRPDVVGVGENHALYAHESLRALRLVKELLPETKTVAEASTSPTSSKRSWRMNSLTSSFAWRVREHSPNS